MQRRVTRKRATYLLHRMYALLHEGGFSFSFGKRLNLAGRGVYAIGDFKYDEDGTRKIGVLIDPSTRVEGGIIALAFHEMLHELYEDLSESKINALEKKMIRLLTARQLANFLKRLVDFM